MAHQGQQRWILGGVASLVTAVFALGVQTYYEGYLPPSTAPLTIGPVAQITEVSSGVDFVARVDTGAAVSSLHCAPEDCEIIDAAEDPWQNVGKPVRLRVENRDGKRAWIETQIADYTEVRSANGAEHRYRVRLPLKCGSVNKTAIVNLNDRSRMTYRMLLGRDFLAGHFLVDVSRSDDNSSL